MGEQGGSVGGARRPRIEGPAGSPSYRALVRVPSLLRVLVGTTVARTAGSMTSVGIILFTLDRFRSPALAGAVGFAMLFPGLVASPIAGALLDRYGRVHLVMLDYLLGAASLGLIAALALAGQLPPWALVATAAVSSLTAPLSASGVRSLFPVMVPEHLWERANAVDSNGLVLAWLAGPPAAAALVQLLGGATALLVIGGLQALAALLMAGVRLPRPPAAPREAVLRSARDGLGYVWRNRTLRGLGVSISLVNYASGMLEIALPLVLVTRLHEPPALVGLAWSAMAAAALVPALLAGRLDTRGIERTLLAGAMAAMGPAVAVLLVANAAWAVLLSMVLVGLATGPLDVATQTIRQRRTDPAMMGRAFAVSMSVNSLGMPIGSLVSGWLAGTSLDAAIALGAAACMLAALATRAMLDP